jgi:hypothetical protein
MTGAPAETWRKFRFESHSALGIPFDVLTGGFFGAGYFSTRGRKAKGRLPLTNRARRRMRMATWIPLSAIPISLLLVVTAYSLPSWIKGAAGVLGLVVLLAGLIGFLIARSLIGPKGKVIPRPPGIDDQLVELRNVHPAFVIAVQQMQQARAAQYSSTYPPLPPGSI